MDSLKTVCLMGSSCNPPTGAGGHRLIAKHFADRYDEVWVLPVYKHIFASKRNLADFEDRLAMAKLNFESVAPNVKVLRLEEEVVTAALKAAMDEGQDPTKFNVGSYDLLLAIKAKHPDLDLGWVMGADTYNDLRAGKWKNSELIPKMVKIQLVVRPGVQLEHEPLESVTVHAIPGQDDISSTKVRESSDLDFLSEVLDPAVLQYIQEHKMYGFSEAPAEEAVSR